MADATISIGPEAKNEKLVGEWLDAFNQRLVNQGAFEVSLADIRAALAGHRLVKARWVIMCDTTGAGVKALVLMTDPEPI